MYILDGIVDESNYVSILPEATIVDEDVDDVEYLRNLHRQFKEFEKENEVELKRQKCGQLIEIRQMKHNGYKQREERGKMENEK